MYDLSFCAEETIFNLPRVSDSLTIQFIIWAWNGFAAKK